jgi:hypothetical protein
MNDEWYGRETHVSAYEREYGSPLVANGADLISKAA